MGKRDGEIIASSRPAPIVIPKGIDPDEYMRRRRASALGNVSVNEATGVATVNCPYCAMFMRAKHPQGNPIDITRFLEQEGKKAHVTRCSEGHRVEFKSTAQWREERQRMGLQVKN